MSVWRQLGAVSVEMPTVVTVGNFDGVHRGHQAVLARCAAQSRGRHGAPVAAVTFDPHPLAVLAPERAPQMLTDLDQRIELLVANGVDHVVVLAFDQAMASWSPGEFVNRVLVDALHAEAVVVGADFRFGARAAGSVDTLTSEGNARGFAVDGVDLATGQRATPWSSSAVRAALADGDVSTATRILGRHHAVRGVVVEGDRRGRELGYPTANVPAPDSVAVPADGVYAGTARRLDDRDAIDLPAAISVGTNPTFANVSRRIEAYVLGRDDLDWYGATVEVTFHARLRAQVRFDGVTELMAQMVRDVEDTRAVLSPGGEQGRDDALLPQAEGARGADAGPALGGTHHGR